MKLLDKIGKRILPCAFLSILMIGPGPGQAQGPSQWEWSEVYNSNTPEYIYDIAVDSVNGFIYAVGSIEEISQQGSLGNTQQHGGADGFLAQYDLNGTFNWIVAVGGTADDKLNAVAVAPNGNVFVTGTFKGFADYDGDDADNDGNIVGNGGSDIVLASYSPSGTLNWVQSYGDWNSDEGLTITTNQSQVFIGGYSYGSVQIGNETTPAAFQAGRTGFVAAFLFSGDPVWTDWVGSTMNDEIQGVTVVDDILVITGSTEDASANMYHNNNISWSTSSTSDPGSLFIMGLETATGAHQWSHSIDVPGTLNGANLLGVASGCGNIFVSGSVPPNTTLGNGDQVASTMGSADRMGLVMRLDPATGANVWHKSISPSGGAVEMNDAVVGPGGFLRVAGSFENSIQIDAGRTIDASSNRDIFGLSYAPGGNVMHGMKVPGSGDVQHPSIDGIDGSIFVAGSFESDVQLPPNVPVGPDLQNCFLARYDDPTSTRNYRRPSQWVPPTISCNSPTVIDLNDGLLPLRTGYADAILGSTISGDPLLALEEQDGQSSEFHADGELLVLDLTDTLFVGESVLIRCKVGNWNTGTATLRGSASEDQTTWVQLNDDLTFSNTSYSYRRMDLPGPTRYLKLKLVGSVGAELDNIAYWAGGVSGGTWSGDGVVSGHLFDPSQVSTWPATVSYQVGQAPCSNITTQQISMSSVSGGVLSGSTTVCPGNNSGLLQLSGHTGNVVAWHISQNAFSTYSVLPTTFDNLSYNNLTTDTWYRVVVEDSNCGEMYSDFALISVEDAEAPEFDACPLDMTEFSEQGVCGTTLQMPILGTTDNCAGTLSTLSAESTDLSNGVSSSIDLQNGGMHFFSVGQHQVTYTANDGNGNSSTCSFQVEVQDTMPPQFGPLGDQTLYMNQYCSAIIEDYTSQLTVNDNCGTVVSVTQTPTAGSWVTGDSVLVTLVATDDQNNSDSLPFYVTLLDTLNPLTDCQSNFIVPLYFGACTWEFDLIEAVGWNECHSGEIYSSIPEGTVLTGGFYPIDATYINLNGDSTFCTNILEIVDSDPPDFITCPDPIEVAMAANCGAVVPDLTGLSTTLAVDCGDTLDISQVPVPGTIVYTDTTVVLTASDNYGLSTNCNVQISLVDTTPPTLTCPNDTSLTLAPGECFVTLDPLVLTGAGDCSAFVVSHNGPINNQYATGSVLVEIEAEDQNGHSSFCSFTVTVLDPSDLVLQYPSSQVCIADPTTLAPSVNINGGTYSSTPGLQLDLTSGEILPNASLAGEYEVFYVIDNGCADSASFIIEVLDQADASFQYSAVSYCPSESNPVPTVAGTTGLFSASPSGLTLDTNSGEINLAVSSPGIYNIQQIVGSGCPDTAFFSLEVLEPSDASFQYASNIFCTNGQDPSPIGVVTLGGTFQEQTGLLELDPNTGAIDVSNSPTGLFEVMYIVANPCPDTAIFEVSIVSQPNAGWEPGGPYCEDQGTLDLSALLIPGADPNGAWFGAGVSGNFLDLSTVTDSVELTYSVGNGTCLSVSSQWIAVDQMPVADAGADQEVCGLNTTLNATLFSGTGQWQPVNGITFNDLTDPNTTVNAIGTGTYTLTWYVTNGACTASAQMELTFSPMLLQPNAGNDETLCNDGYNLQASTSAFGTWSVASGTGSFSDPNDPNAFVSGLSVGTNELVWTVDNGICAPLSDVVEIVLMPEADASWNAPASICASAGSIDLNTLATNTGGTWTWPGGSGNIFDPSGLSGIIDITYTIGQLPCQDVSTQQVQVWQEVTASFSNIDPICSSASPVNLNDHLTGNSGGSWTANGSPLTDGILDPILFNGTVNIEYIVGGPGCEESAQGSIQIIEDIAANAGPDQQVCGLIVDLQATPDPNGQWSGPSGTTYMPDASAANATATVLNYGVHTFVWSISNGACSSSDETSVEFFEPIDPATVFAGEDQDIPFGDGTTLSADTPPMGQGTWSSETEDVSIADPNDPNSGVSGLPVGSTVLTWTVSNGPCAGFSDDVIITTHDFFIPQGFSPNNDGTNDFFEITGIERFADNELDVFDRWGKRVYHATGYHNEWSGLNDRGMELPNDTYFYVLNLKGVTTYNGFVIINR